MKRLNQQIGLRRLAWCLVGLSCLLLPGCPPPSCSNLTQPDQDFPVTTLAYGAGLTLDVSVYDGASLRRGDVVTLHFPCAPTLAVASVPGLQIDITGQDVKIMVLASVGAPGSHALVPFSTPNYEFEINVLPDVWPGDANADGRRNMHDLMPIALGIRNAVSGAAGTPLAYPPNPVQMNAFQNVADWPGKQFTFAGRDINFKHADCNLDGVIDFADVEYLYAVIGPVAPPDFLNDAVNGMRLKAIYDPNRPIDYTITESGEVAMQIDFDIEFADTTGFTDSIFGVLFTRPVTETAAYQVDTTTFRFLLPNVFTRDVTGAMLWGQRFWDALDVTSDEDSCGGVVDKPLDVGVFKIDGPLFKVSQTGSARIGNCQVTLIDILHPGQPLPPTLDFHHHLLNGAVYTLGADGLSINSLSCESTVTSIDLTGLCSKKRDTLLIRDQVADNGHGITPYLKAWNSPDIWVRHNEDVVTQHQDPVLGNTEQIYVRVFNPSCNAVDGAVVDIYAGEFKAGLQGNDLDLIGSVPNVTIPAWGHTIVSVPWEVRRRSGTVDPNNSCFSILATVGTSVISSPALPSGTFGSNVCKERAMAMRTTKTLRSVDGTEIAAGCILGAPINAGLQTKISLDLIQGSSSHPASQYGKLVIQAPGMGNPVGCTAIGSDQHQVLPAATHAELVGIPGSPIQVSYTKIPGVGPAGPLSYTYLLSVEVGGNQYPGITFKITLP